MIRNYSLFRFHSCSEDHSQSFRIARRRRHAGSSKLTTQKQLDGPCTIHCFEDDWGRIRSSHTLRSYRLFTELSDGIKKEKQRKAKRDRETAEPPVHNSKEQYPPSHRRVCMIQEGRPSKTKQEAHNQQAREGEDLLTEETYHLYG